MDKIERKELCATFHINWYFCFICTSIVFKDIEKTRSPVVDRSADICVLQFTYNNTGGRKEHTENLNQRKRQEGSGPTPTTGRGVFMRQSQATPSSHARLRTQHSPAIDHQAQRAARRTLAMTEEHSASAGDAAAADVAAHDDALHPPGLSCGGGCPHRCSMIDAATAVSAAETSD